MALLLLAATTASAADPLPSHPMRPHGMSGAPGLYAQYKWATPAPPPSKDMETDHTWISIPKGTDSDGNGVFASSQYWYEAYDQPCPNHSDHGMSCNSAGYMGSQVMRGSPAGTERVVFIFSCWDADSAHKVGWTEATAMDKAGNGCARFGGEGTGSHCMFALPVKEGVQHNFRVEFAGKNDTGALWTGTVTNKATGTKTVVGTLFHPHLPNRVGFGDFKSGQSDDFLEYFAGGDCGAVKTSIGIEGPYFNGGTVTPLQAMPAYSAGGCNESDVAACIPGHGCGHPRVLLSGGKGVVRKNPNGKPLWKPV